MSNNPFEDFVNGLPEREPFSLLDMELPKWWWDLPESQKRTLEEALEDPLDRASRIVREEMQDARRRYWSHRIDIEQDDDGGSD